MEASDCYFIVCPKLVSLCNINVSVDYINKYQKKQNNCWPPELMFVSLGCRKIVRRAAPKGLKKSDVVWALEKVVLSVVPYHSPPRFPPAVSPPVLPHVPPAAGLPTSPHCSCRSPPMPGPVPRVDRPASLARLTGTVHMPVNSPIYPLLFHSLFSTHHY